MHPLKPKAIELGNSTEKSEIIGKLLQMGFEESQVTSTVKQCCSIEDAILLLTSLSECHLCTEERNETEMVAMLFCHHKCCRICAKQYFTNCIREKGIRCIVCPFCSKPYLSDNGSLCEYFSNMSLVLKEFLDKDVYELFQRKLRDVVLDADPNVLHCPKCEFCCYIVDFTEKRFTCRGCNITFCIECNKEWDRYHNGGTCKQIEKWNTTTENESLCKYLDQNGIDCPNCKSRFALSKGGCMHFKCPSCKHEFCCGCQRPFKQGNICKISENCQNLGLHAHHPRNCLFYLRDCDIKDLQSVLKKNQIQFQSSQGICNEGSKCEIMEQKETADGFVDDICGRPRIDGQAGLCRLHYNEYLVHLLTKYQLDPIRIMSLDEILAELCRNGIFAPKKLVEENDDKYKTRLTNLVKEKIPLEDTRTRMPNL